MTAPVPRILVVDDDPALLGSLGALLREHGCRVDLAPNGIEALRRNRRHAYDILLCDIEMPEMSGLELVERIRRDGQPRGVIMMTGHLEPEYYIQAIRLGVADFLCKPIETGQLLEAVQNAMDKNHSVDSLRDFLANTEQASISCVIDPLRFMQHSVLRILGPFLYRNLDLPQDLLNVILACSDEMLQNAFIHGVLGLTVEQRGEVPEKLNKLISVKLQNPAIAARRIRYELVADHAAGFLRICVEDDGEGFDHEAVLNSQAGQDSPPLEGHGHGLAMLGKLSDELLISHGGRKIQTVHRIQPGTAPGP